MYFMVQILVVVSDVTRYDDRGNTLLYQVERANVGLQPLDGIQSHSPIVVTVGQQYNVGEKPTVMLYTYIKCRDNFFLPCDHGLDF